MKTILFSVICIFLSSWSFGQSVIEWQPNYKLTLSDFQSPATEINEKLTSYSLLLATNVDFSYAMSSYEFMFTKNFNSKVKTVLNKSASSLIAPSQTLTTQLLRFGQFNFDLTELYSRKLRKELYEKKGAFSNVSFFQPIFEKNQTEMSNRYSVTLKESDLGKNKIILEKAHKQVLLEIEALSEFCKECKPLKKKKRKKK